MSRLRTAIGLTLIEMLVALSIFSVLGLFTFVLMRQSLGIYRSARGSGEYQDKYDQLTRAMVDDLTCVRIGDPEGEGEKLRFLVTRDREYVPPESAADKEKLKSERGWAQGDPRALLIRFVRSFPGGELEDTIGRYAGTYPGATAYVDGVDDFDESRAGSIVDAVNRAAEIDRRGAAPGPEEVLPGLLAPRGLMEVVYFLDRDQADRSGSFTLYRAVRSPVGGADSFFATDFRAKLTPEWMAAHAKAVVTGIAYFAVVMRSQKTVDWREEEVLSGIYLAAKDHDASESWWDSTRAFHEQFSLHRGSASATDWQDDVFPSALRFVVTIVEEGLALGDARLLNDLAANERSLRISDASLFGADGAGATHLRIDDEWMEVEVVTGQTLRVRRGARQTSTQRHLADAPVIVGRTFRRTIEIPAHRSWFRGVGEEVR